MATQDDDRHTLDYLLRAALPAINEDPSLNLPGLRVIDHEDKIIHNKDVELEVRSTLAQGGYVLVQQLSLSHPFLAPGAVQPKRNNRMMNIIASNTKRVEPVGMYRNHVVGFRLSHYKFFADSTYKSASRPAAQSELLGYTDKDAIHVPMLMGDFLDLIDDPSCFYNLLDCSLNGRSIQPVSIMYVFLT